MTIEIILLAIIAVMAVLMVVLTTYTIHRDMTKMDNNLKIQIASASANRKPDIHKMSYEDLMKIVNTTIDYFTSQNMEILALSTKSSEEISLMIDELTVDISSRVVLGLSDEVRGSVTAYVSEDFFNRYIYNSVQTLIVLNIEKEKRKNTPKPVQKTETK